jgi:hypothetical protein
MQTEKSLTIAVRGMQYMSSDAPLLKATEAK